MVRDTNATLHDKSGYWPGRTISFWTSMAKTAFDQVHALAGVKGRRGVVARRMLRSAKQLDLHARPYRVMDYHGRRIIVGWTASGTGAPTFGPLR